MMLRGASTPVPAARPDAGRRSRRAVFEECEPRILYSADLDPIGSQGPAPSAAAIVRVVETAAPAAAAGAPTGATIGLRGAGTHEAQQTRHEIVFIDASVEGVDAFVADLTGRDTPGLRTEVVVLRADRDGLSQISEVLAGRQDLDAIHVVAHGGQAQLQLGSTTVDRPTLDARATELAAWARALSPDADLLIYGCEVAAGDPGRDFIATLAQRTGADVAASTDLTGAAAQGANWSLEAQIGSIEARQAFSADFEAGWTGVLATFTVTSTADAGAGSLRQAILDANAAGGTNTIAFNLGGGGPQSINVLSELPMIANQTIVDGTSAPTYAGQPMVILQGNGGAAVGLRIGASADGSVIKGLVIRGFGASGIEISPGANQVEISGNHIGALTSDGQTSGTAGNGMYGVMVWGSDSRITGNVISGNASDGIFVVGAVTGTVIQGNKIGTDVTGSNAIANGRHGITLYDGVNGSLIGGAATGEGNVISGNQASGINVDGNGSGNAVGNRILGNQIGTNAAGTAALANHEHGIGIYSAVDTVVGGAAVGEGNLISGNLRNGVAVEGTTARGTLVLGNRIGTSADGMSKIGNGWSGVSLDDSGTNRIGGSAPGEGNLISGNLRDGVLISNPGALANTVQGNRIGLDATGGTALGNGRIGVNLYAGGGATLIGGATVGAGNAISGNVSAGISIDGQGHASARDMVIAGNLIGLAADGLTLAGNGGSGIIVNGGVLGLTIGGASAAERNVIGGNAQIGIHLRTGGAGALVQGNYIGVGANGSLAAANALQGVSVQVGQARIIGNVVSANGTAGIDVWGGGAEGVRLQGNRIGTDASGTVARGNGTVGITIYGGARNTLIGGTGANEGNQIAGNGLDGILIVGAGTTGTVVLGNRIGTNAAGDLALANLRHGILLSDDASMVTIGTSAAGGGNLISGNAGSGIRLEGSDGSGVGSVSIANNLIGVDQSGRLRLGNLGAGIDVMSGAGWSTIIGGANADDRNVISGNGQMGILLAIDAQPVIVQGNLIGLDVDGAAAVGNVHAGMDVRSAGNKIAGNVIAGNGEDGVFVYGSTATGNEFFANRIGTSADGLRAIANLGNGVHVLYGAADTMIGDGTALNANLIAGNGRDGIAVAGATTVGVRIQGNQIGTDISGVAPLGNGRYGILLFDGVNAAVVGGTVLGAGNVIAGSGAAGVMIDGDGNAQTRNISILGNFVGIDRGGSVGLGNAGEGILITRTVTEVMIGDVGDARNLISANHGDGIHIEGATVIGIIIRNNGIGTGASGLEALGNGGDGVRIVNAAQITIGGLSAAERNVIVANGGDGVSIEGGQSSDIVVQGNYIGLGADGSTLLGNTGHGVRVSDGAVAVLGGSQAGAGNVISGNLQGGIRIDNASGVQVLGNRIGVDATGTLARGNAVNGILLTGSGGGHQIGAAGAGNVISANSNHGVTIEAGSSGNTIQANRIGTSADGLVFLGAQADGIYIASDDNLVGGMSAAQGNQIAGNNGAAVAILGDRNEVVGNLIGVDSSAAMLAMANAIGIWLTGSAQNNRIGSALAAGGNRIAYSQWAGVVVDSSARGNAILSNLIHGNQALGIDLGSDGPTANDAGDVDSGPNDLVNYPTLTLAVNEGGSLRYHGGIFDGAPGTSLVQVYANDAANVGWGGHGQGQRLIDSFTVTVPASGTETFMRILTGQPLPEGDMLSATATVWLGADTYGSTSEFSANLALSQAPVITSNGGGDTGSVTLPSGQTAVTTVTATDADVPAQTLVYSIAGGADAARFAINASTGALVFVVAPDAHAPTDHDADNVYHVIVRVSDGLLDDSQALSIAVTGSVGAVSDADAAANQVLENAVNGTPVGITASARDPDAGEAVHYSLDNDADGRFAIDATTGVVTVADGSRLDHESAASHVITVRATSDDGSASTLDLTIQVLDVNEAPMGPVTDANPAANRVAETAANGTPVGITAVATDPDGTDQPTHYTLDDDAGGRFAIDVLTGVVTVADGALLNHDVASSHDILVRATSPDGSWSTLNFAIAVLAVNDSPVGPVTDLDPGPDLISADVGGGASVGITAHAVDPDRSVSQVSYRLDDDADGRFAIHATTGVVSVRDPARFDLTATHEYAIVVRADSADGSSSQAVFRITVAAVADAGGGDSPGEGPGDGEPTDPVPPVNPVPPVVPETPVAPVSPVSPPAPETPASPATPAGPLLPSMPPALPSIPSSSAPAGSGPGAGDGARSDVAASQDRRSAIADPGPETTAAAEAVAAAARQATARLMGGPGLPERPADMGDADSAPGSHSVSDGHHAPAEQAGPPAPQFTAELAAWTHADAGFVFVPWSGTSDGPPTSLPLAGSFSVATLSASEAVGEGSWDEQMKTRVGDWLARPVVLTGSAITAGFVWWLTRSGGVLTLILMGVPAWRHVDLLPIVARFDEEEDPEVDPDDLSDPEEWNQEQLLEDQP